MDLTLNVNGEGDPNQRMLSLMTPQPIRLVRLEVYHPQGSSQLDGKRIEAKPLKLPFSVIEIPAGDHELAL
ncbi:MAG: hypothetical protein A2527_04275 [Candidatus Lambdaproteobacteria bacterium RIFOXYD2_FULL_50_16]|uniref:PEGA domain-containing protein n=1 Tax=Candidatus Lambdaproteobacteria bacterium RIFOXYD2_FULL_50_16 TaxID=1817772 RepID=A0A1F6G4C0_9PROT|nr:MAG: hypothetical protein A2527_04275 [Candidatus Lambdaproteobacteria bacterium RIFOXYD2_FULL_50_16]